MKVNACTVTETYVTQPADPHDSWDRDNTREELLDIVVVQAATGEFEVDAGIGHKVYVVYTRYSEGDTFGHDEGLTQILDVFVDEDEAIDLLVRVQEMEQLPRIGAFNRLEDGKKSYYVAGAHDYFGSLDSSDIWETRIKRS